MNGDIPLVSKDPKGWAARHHAELSFVLGQPGVVPEVVAMDCGRILEARFKIQPPREHATW